MKISLEIVLEALQSYCVDDHVCRAEHVSFQKCLPLPMTPTALERECLYIGKLSKALELRGSKRPDVYCICLRDRLPDDTETETSLSGLVIVNENMRLSELTSAIQGRFFKIHNWIMDMLQVSISQGSIQQILDLSKHILNVTTIVCDASLQLLAHSNEALSEDPITEQIIKHGFYPDRLVKKLLNNAKLFNWRINTIVIDDSCAVMKHVTLHQVFMNGDTFLGHMFISCPSCSGEGAVPRSLVDLFLLLVDVIRIQLRHSAPQNAPSFDAQEKLLYDLLDGTVPKNTASDGTFYVFELDLDHTSDIRAQIMCTELRKTFSNVTVVMYNQRIVALARGSAGAKDMLRDLKAQLTPLLEKHEAICGLSGVFNQLSQTRHYHKQATQALKVAARSRQNTTIDTLKLEHLADIRVRDFNDDILLSMLADDPDNGQSWYHSYLHDRMKLLAEYDHRSGNDYLRLLFNYLRCMGNATLAAKKLHMHRNNVVYHIKKIEELLNCDLTTADTLLTTALSYKLFKLYGLKDDADGS